MSRPPLEAHPPPTLTQRAQLAVAWTVGFNLFRDLLQFGLMLVLVRLLPPEAYGQFGFVTTLLSFLTLFSFREFSGHILQVRRDEDVPYQDHFSAGGAIQLALFGLTNVIALALSTMPAYQAVSPLLHLMSVMFLLDLPSEFRVRMLERALAWQRLRLLHALALIVGAVLSVTLAFAGGGVYALLVPLFVVPLPFAWDLFVTAGWRPDWTWKRVRYQPAWRFGSARILSVSFVSAAGLLESTWLTRAIGFAAFGIFGRAIGLSTLLCGRVAGLLAGSLYPLLTRIPPRTDAYRRASAIYLRSVGWSMVPACVCGSLLAGPIVHALYGDRWVDVIPLLPWALVGGALAAIVQTGHTLLLAHGRQDRCLIADMCRLCGTALALLLLLPFGLVPYLGAIVGVYGLQLAMVLYWLAGDRAVTASGVMAALLPPVVCAGAAALVMLPLLSGAPHTSVARGLVGGVLFLSAYVVLLRCLFRQLLEDLVAYFPQRARLTRVLRLTPSPALP